MKLAEVVSLDDVTVLIPVLPIVAVAAPPKLFSTKIGLQQVLEIPQALAEVEPRKAKVLIQQAMVELQ